MRVPGKALPTLAVTLLAGAASLLAGPAAPAMADGSSATCTKDATGLALDEASMTVTCSKAALSPGWLSGGACAVAIGKVVVDMYNMDQDGCTKAANGGLGFSTTLGPGYGVGVQFSDPTSVGNAMLNQAGDPNPSPGDTTVVVVEPGGPDAIDNGVPIWKVDVVGYTNDGGGGGGGNDPCEIYSSSGDPADCPF
jgi:hypothetical protein